MKHIPGVDMSTGSLGLGISAACGMALAAKRMKQDWRVWTIVGDGESEEGQVWEAAMFAAHYKLDNLCAFMNPTPLDEKFKAFGWHVIMIDAHDLAAIDAAVKEAKATKGQPTAIIAKSVKGKGVSYMENAVNWHGAAPKQEQYEIAVKELDEKIAELSK